MGEKDTLIKETMIYTGMAIFKDVYAFGYQWLKDEEIDMIEDNYTEKVKADGKDIEIKWKGMKMFDDYFKMHVDIKWKVLRLTDVEVQIDGKTKKMNKFVELKMEIKGMLETDYMNKWGKTGFQKMLKETYNKHLIKDRKLDRENEVKDLCRIFKEEIKAFLELSGKRVIDKR